MEAVMTEVIAGGLSGSSWVSTDEPGIDYAVLRPQPDGGATIFLRFAKGTHGPEHTHPGGEELYVVSGDITIGGRRLRAGDYLYTPPGPSHDADAHEDTVMLVSLPKLPEFV
jgi:quercetin dioxygenase-like cupin family protein